MLEGVPRFFEDAPPRFALTEGEIVLALRDGADDAIEVGVDAVVLRGRFAFARELEVVEGFAFFVAFFGFASFGGCAPPNIPSNPLMIYYYAI